MCFLLLNIYLQIVLFRFINRLICGLNFLFGSYILLNYPLVLFDIEFIKEQHFISYSFLLLLEFGRFQLNHFFIVQLVSLLSLRLLSSLLYEVFIIVVHLYWYCLVSQDKRRLRCCWQVILERKTKWTHLMFFILSCLWWRNLLQWIEGALNVVSFFHEEKQRVWCIWFTHHLLFLLWNN